MGWLRDWWGQPDNYRWLSGYLDSHNLRTLTRRITAMVVLSLGAVPLLSLWTPVGPDTMVGNVVVVLVFVCATAMAVLWLIRWPTRAQSLQFVLLANACIAASCLAYSSPSMKLLGCTGFVALAGYVAFLHTSRYLALVLATAGVVSIAAAIEMAAAGRPIIALAKLLIIAVGVLAVPLAHVLVRLLGDDALKSHTDPLTGLRNRRGFYRSARELMDLPLAEAYFSVIMLDLDRFKQVNDTQGHTTGDRILVAVADTLRHCTRGRAVVARIGGEEFLIAEMTRSGEAQAIAERLRKEVAAIPLGATASVGVASIRWIHAGDAEARAVIEHLVDAADAAMYEAKRAGGNQMRHAESTGVTARGRHAR